MIKLSIIGHLGKDAVSNLVGGKNVINFSVAHSTKYRNQNNELVEQTIWVECNYWTDKTAILPYLKKGSLVFVEGTPNARAYMSKENKPEGALNCRVADVQLLGGRAENSSNTTPNEIKKQQSTQNNNNSNNEETSDDLPF